MHATKRIVIDLLSGNRPETIHVVQGDAYSRVVEIDLRQGKKPWAIPDGISVAVEYIKPDGTKGLYDTLPDGTQAWNTEGNILTLMLAPQMLTANGSVATQVSITKDNARLSLFKFWVYVNQKIRGAESEDYINWRSAFLPQVEGAKAGQYFEIEEVDKNGRIVKIKPVDAPQGAGGGITVESDPTVPEWAKQPNPPSVDIPKKLPNPHALTIKGAVNATYDGSEAVEVEIPQGGGGGLTGFELIDTIDVAELGQSGLKHYVLTGAKEILLKWSAVVNSSSSNSTLLVDFNVDISTGYNTIAPKSGKSGSPLYGFCYYKLIRGVGLLAYSSAGAISGTNYAIDTTGGSPYNLIPVAAEEISEFLINNPPTQYYATGGTVEIYAR